MVERKFFKFRNLKLSYLDTNTSNKKVIILTHANGFSAETYSYIFRNLGKDFRFLGLDFAGQGSSEGTKDFKNWFFSRDQIISLIEHEKLENVILVGHSLGGGSSVLVSKKIPEKIEKMILFDPTFLYLYVFIYKFFFPFPIAKRALKRRNEFKNLELIKRSFRNFPIFSDWDSEVFGDFIHSCFKKEGEIYKLSCHPEIEARYFETPSFSNFLNYGKNKIETHIIIPEKYEVCSPYRAKKIISGNEKSSLEINPALNHFFPFIKKDFTLDRLMKFLNP